MAQSRWRASLVVACLLQCGALQTSAVSAAEAPRGVILFVGDGMGISTVTAARILDGQNRGQPGEENYLAFEKFPNVALVKTYNVDAQVSDSAGTMTALVTGHKARAGVLSVAPAVARGDCAGAQGQALTTLLEEAEQRGAYRALTDTIAFADAVAVAVERTDPAETLIVVTADHSHTLTIAGYPARGNPILGYAAGADGKPQRDMRGVAYTTLGYANGPGALRNAEEDAAPTDPSYRQRATHPLRSETHAGEDVPAYALGLGAEGVRGVMDQHELHGVMRAALFGEALAGEAPGPGANAPARE